MPLYGKSEPLESNQIHAGYKPVALPMSYVPKDEKDQSMAALTKLPNQTAHTHNIHAH